jgi:hypothetical protein
VGNPPGQTNLTTKLLWAKLESEATLFPLKLALKDWGGRNLGRINRGNESSTFRLNLKNCGRMLSIFHFCAGAMVFHYFKLSQLNNTKHLIMV